MEENRKKLGAISFSLCCKQMVGPDIYLHNVKSNFKISMVKTLVFRKIEIPQNQQSLYCMGLVMEDHKNLAFYNVDSDSNILIVRRLRGNASTRATALLIN